MAAFDPYHKWLGIPQEDQPANHYRLLGLRDFESDPDVIDLAANKQMVFLHSCSTGEHFELAEQLLNEISAARLCLLGTETKRVYDTKLRSRSRDSSGTVITVSSRRRKRPSRQEQNRKAASQVEDEFDDVLDADFEDNTKPSSVRSLARTRRQRVRRRRAANRLRLIVGGCVVLVLVAIGFLLSGGDPSEPASTDTRGDDSIASNDSSATAGDSIAGSGPSVTADEFAATANAQSDSTAGVDSSVEPPQLDRDPPPPAVAPFDTAEAQSHQKAWAEHLGVPIESTNSIGMKFVVIPPGEFTMGSPESEPRRKDDETLHKVTLTQPFQMGMHEVTQEQYERVMGGNPSRFQGPQNPVERVSWGDAVEFCRKLTALIGE